LRNTKSIRRTLTVAGLLLLGVMAVASCGISNWKLVSMDSRIHALPFSSLFFVDSDNGLALTVAELLETSDGGKTWTKRFASDDQLFHSMQFVTQTTGFIVGLKGGAGSHNALLLRTDDSGKTWYEIALDLPTADGDRSLYSISFCNPQTGWAVGSDLVLRTTNGGRSWEVQHTNQSEGFLDVSCVSAEQAWIVGPGGLILQTRDSGKTWSRVPGGATVTLRRVKTFGNDGWIVGGLLDNGVLLRTHDRGASWERIELNATEPLRDIYINGKRGWIVGVGGKIFESTDGGETWTQQYSPTDDDLACLFFLSSHHGWAGGERKTVLLFSD